MLPSYKHMNALLLALVLLIFQPVFAAETEVHYGECGKIIESKGFKFKHAGFDYFIPKYTKILKSNELIYSNISPQTWKPPYNGAKIYTFEELLLLNLWDTDCVDLSKSEIFIFSEKGNLLLRQEVWTEHWENGFFSEDGILSYWSEWFCSPSNKSRISEMSYIYKLNKPRTRFEKVDVDQNKYCSKKFKLRFKEDVFKFRPSLSSM